MIKIGSLQVKDHLYRLISTLNNNSTNLLVHKCVEPNFQVYKELLISNELTPSYFAPSIKALIPENNLISFPLSEEEKELRISTLESLLRNEICKNMININVSDKWKRDIRVVSIGNYLCIYLIKLYCL